MGFSSGFEHYEIAKWFRTITVLHRSYNISGYHKQIRKILARFDTILKLTGKKSCHISPLISGFTSGLAILTFLLISNLCYCLYGLNYTVCYVWGEHIQWYFEFQRDSWNVHFRFDCVSDRISNWFQMKSNPFHQEFS